MTPWEIKIRKGDNGYRISWIEEIGEKGETVEKEEYVEEDVDSESGEAVAAADLLYRVIEHFSLYGSKHNALHVSVKLEHGSNYHCKGCKICKDDLEVV